MPQKIRRSEKAKQDKEERRVQALAWGSEVIFLTCPLCGRNRPLKTHGKPTRFKVKPDYAVITVRKGGGRRIGFFRLPEKDLKLSELKEAYPEVYMNLKESIEELHIIMEEIEK